jgi:DNA mismatch repair protein MutS
MLGTTPMFAQYKKVKDQYQDMILFYRLGDFYEMFDKDAEKASKILGLALTARDGGGGIKVPMCGVPFHAADLYIKKLIAAGQKVAICEQLEDPKLVKGLVKRGIIRVVTPGMLLEDNMLGQSSNYIACIVGKKHFGLAICDVSTGDFRTTTLESAEALLQELSKYNPSECVISAENTTLYATLSDHEEVLGNTNLSPYTSYLFKERNAREKLKEHFQINDLSVLNFNDPKNDGPAMIASAALLGYMTDMLRKEPKHLLHLKYYRTSDSMELDVFTKKNLELVEALNSRHGSTLYEVLNKTATNAGARLLKRWMEEPLTNAAAIRDRLDATDELVNHAPLRTKFLELLDQVGDIERITTRVSCQSASPRDLISLKRSLEVLPEIHQLLATCQNSLFSQFAFGFDDLVDAYDLIEASILDDPSYLVRDGGVIRPSYNSELEDLNKLMAGGQDWLDDYLEKEKERTGIKNLKIGNNKVFGYYLDVTKSYQSQVPADYIRKQTLANSERYITDDLKKMEDQILGASERAKSLEEAIYRQIVSELALSTERFQSVSRILSAVDVFCAFAVVSVENNYCKPQISPDSIEIKDLRHPVIEEQTNLGNFTPNDVFLEPEDQRFLIITGPNMSGKSTYCRSVALASIMMQIGCFVPASQASMRVCDRVFARIGASDFLAGGQSTFMVEMNEVAAILNNATADSLIILDEVGRGTSTYDGLALAIAITKYINERLGSFTLFATHYHELTALDADPGIQNYTVSVLENESSIVFLHKIIPGSASKSYGIHVAMKAGIPSDVIYLANEVLSDLEQEKGADQLEKKYTFPEKQMSPEPSWLSEFKSLDTENMTVREMAAALMDFVDRANTDE